MSQSWGAVILCLSECVTPRGRVSRSVDCSECCSWRLGSANGGWCSSPSGVAYSDAWPHHPEADGVSDVINTVQSGGDITDAGLDPCLDLDTLRMYLRWRATSLTEIRVDSSWFRSSAPVPWITGEFSDGRVDRVAGFDEVTESSPRVDGLGVAWAFPGEEVDPWGASAFVQTAGEKYVWMSESVYGDSPASIRRGLEMVSSQRTVWVSPGLPFLCCWLGCNSIWFGVDLFGFVVRAI